MILKSVETFNIDLKESVLTSDNERDLLTGQNAGIGKNLYIQDLLRVVKTDSRSR